MIQAVKVAAGSRDGRLDHSWGVWTSRRRTPGYGARGTFALWHVSWHRVTMNGWRPNSPRERAAMAEQPARLVETHSATVIFLGDRVYIMSK